MPPPLRLIAYHYVVRGRLTVSVEGHPPIEAEAGTIILLPRNDPHRLGSGLDVRPVDAGALIQQSPSGGLARIVSTGDGERTQILCGFLGTDAPGSPVLGLMPAILTLDVEEGASASWIESSLRFAAGQLVAGRVEQPAMLGRLAELLFLEAVRRYVASLPPGHGRWQAGFSDPVIGRALSLMHSRLTHRWTTEELAREAGLSRSAFAERFGALLGDPPMRYLGNCRMQYAAERLRGTRDPVAAIAYDAGYESEAAFNRAFKRAFGLPPNGWRKRNGQSRSSGIG
jgi:AraC-like DNA-binding protein